MPKPKTARRPRVSTRMPPSLAPPTRRSFGHLSAACPTPSMRKARAAATPATSERPATGLAIAAESEKVISAPGAVYQRRPRRPRPAVCSSAASSTPGLPSSSSIVLVEPQRSTRRTSIPARSMGASLRGCEIEVSAGRCGEEGTCVLVLRPQEDLLGGALLDDASGLHHGHPVADLRRDAQVVRD